MQDKPMLILTLILSALICLYFIIFGFSRNPWTRVGQYGGLVTCGLLIIDCIFRPY